MTNQSEKTAYPLAWPDNWPRTARHLVGQSRFGRTVRHGQHSMVKVREELSGELERLGARNPILSTNVELRLDGQPMANRARPSDCGAAVYFTLKGKPTVLACDRWNRVEDNIWAICKKIYNIREDDRNGVGTIAQAFRGYTALPESVATDWWKVFGVPVNCSREAALAAYRKKVFAHHPDTGDGDTVAMTALAEAKREFDRLGT